jgi:hypothetical protein
MSATRRQLKLLFLGVCLCAAGFAHAQAVGTIDKFEGYSRLVGANGSDKTVANGVPLNEGDKMITSASSEAVIKMADGAVMAVRPNSEVVFTNYRINPQNIKDSSVLVRLIKGGLRSVTGLVGKANPNAVRVTTPTATIGIRGTDFEVSQIGAEQGAVTPGTYTRTYSGATFMEGKSGERVEVRAGQAAAAPDAMFGAGAIAFGLLSRLPSGVFSGGKLDAGLPSIQREGMRAINQEIRSNLPPELQGMMPDLVPQRVPQKK